MKFQNGDVYEGNFSNDKMHEEGTPAQMQLETN